MTFPTPLPLKPPASKVAVPEREASRIASRSLSGVSGR